MPRRKQARHTDVKDIPSILRLTFAQGLSIRAVSERLKISKTSVSTYLLRAKEAGLAVWALPPGLDEDDVLEHRLFRRMGRPPRDTVEPNWPKMASDLKRKGVTLHLLWQEYREAHPDGYGYTLFCGLFADHESRARPTYRSRHVAGVAMECDYAGHTTSIIDPSTGEIRAAQIYVAVLSASQLRFAYTSFSRKLPDWIEANQRAFSYFGGVTKKTICDNLKSAVAKALWFEPTLNATSAAVAEHYDTTVVPARPRHPRDKPSAEGTALIVERWVLARLRRCRTSSPRVLLLLKSSERGTIAKADCVSYLASSTRTR
jgi:transposase